MGKNKKIPKAVSFGDCYLCKKRVISRSSWWFSLLLLFWQW